MISKIAWLKFDCKKITYKIRRVSCCCRITPGPCHCCCWCFTWTQERWGWWGWLGRRNCLAFDFLVVDDILFFALSGVFITRRWLWIEVANIILDDVLVFRWVLFLVFLFVFLLPRGMMNKLKSAWLKICLTWFYKNMR